jgi:ribosomal protein L37AE/L43A
MCKHENVAKIDKVWRCRECGEIFDTPPAKIEEKPEAKPVKAAEPKKAPAKKPARKGAK